MTSYRVPRSVMRTSRAEHTDLAFDVVEGAIPADLSGHAFVVAPAGTVAGAPDGRRTTLLVGDGMICRFDLSPRGIRLTSRLARTHDMVADELTARDPRLAPYRFLTSGMMRVGLLGARDFANTAFVPFRRAGESTRLLVTYDAGRPFEIDPRTLAVLGPVGRRAEWRPEAAREAAFPVYLSPGHPVWDRRRGEMFLLNYGRGVANFAATVPLVHLLELLPSWVERGFEQLASIAGLDAAYRWLERAVERGTTGFDRTVERILDRYFPDVPDTFTDLVRWDGAGAMKRYRLVLPDGREVSITQSVHQLAVTREHVVLLHTGFKIGFASTFNDPVPHTDAIDRLMRAALTRPQLPTATFYVVRRAALDDPGLRPGDDGVLRVECRRFDVPIEADHFLADYDDAGGRIALHVAHAPATDLGEWIRPYDTSPYGGPVPPDLHGMLAIGAMDVGRFGRYVLDVAAGTVEESKTLLDDRSTWAIALYAGAAINTDDEAPERLGSVYWSTVGFYPELLTQFVFDLYARYEHRIVPLEVIRGALGRSGRPSTLVRVDAQSLALSAELALPPGVILGSMQHVPGRGDGHLVSTVYTERRTELWIFDAGDLSRGAVCRLAAPGFELGFSLHTAWLPEVAPRTSSYRVTAREELDGHVPDPALRAAFARDLYPRFE